MSDLLKGSEKMKFSYIKLNAQKKLIKNHFVCFCLSGLPYVTIVLLALLNYYLYIFLKDINFISPISSYDVYVKASLFTLSIFISFVLWQITRLYSEKYFFSKNMKTSVQLNFHKCITAITVSILKFVLSIAWGTFYLAPCVVVGATLYYCIRSKEYTFNVMFILFVATIILFAIGTGFVYTTLKRYSMCNYVIFTTQEKNSLKVIVKSIDLMEGNMVKYTLYRISFVGWLLSCVLVIPIFYVLPYVKMAKYSFYKAITRPQERELETQKPIIFYFTQKEKA